MTEDIKEDAESIGNAKIASYETNPGGTNELNGVEASAEKSMRCSEQMRQLSKLQRQVRKLEKCMENLPPEEKEAVRLFYLYRQTYEQMSSSLHISISTCRRRVSKGTKAVAVMLFGERAGEQIQFAS
jgi:RNA polymerase sigma factor (sigma-70 family)